jgi:hypothetical protein
VTPRITEEQFSKALDYASFIKGKEVKFKLADLYDGRFAQALQQ